MITLDSLRAYGANVDEGLARCMNMESFYLKIVNMLVNDDDKSVQRLRDSLAARDTAAVFEAAHALKGSSGNLALTPIYAPVNEMTDLLRARTQTDYTEGLKAVLEARDRLQEICGE